VGRLIFDLGNGQWDIPRLRELLEEILPHRNTLEDFPVEHAFEGLGLRTMLFNARRIPNQGGDESERILVSIEDITERRQIEEALEADRHKNEFLAMLAHELRNPLAPIRNSLALLRRFADAQREDEGLENEASQRPRRRALDRGPSIRSAVDVMERQVGQMVRLVDDLLDVSRISRGRMELRREVIDLAAVVQHAVEGTRPLVESRSQQLAVTLPSEPVYLDADPIRVAQVVGNLLNNASKFTGEGGRIELTVSPDSSHEVSGAARGVVIRVRDTGVGIAPDQLSRIFDMFVQVDSSLGHSAAGLGIGLTLVRTLVEMHGGSVEVHSGGLGQGSEFVVHLPTVGAGREPPPGPTATEPIAADRLRVLVVDDNRDSADSLAMLLRLRGHDTHTAYDGLAAVESAARLHPDVVVLDIGLPGLDGYEAARRIRRERPGRDLLLVALTGWGQDEDRRRSEEAGFDTHLTKPLDHVALLRLLAESRARTRR
jgi:signal transduction histidine kinase/ActR/RegA family two-component response regulator